VTMRVNPILPVSVLISPSANNICAGTPVTFTPAPTNGGTATYQWFKNAVGVSTSPTFTFVPVDGDQVYAVMTSVLTCQSGSPATSNTVAMTVNPLLPVSVSIAASGNPVCAGTSVTYTTTPVNGGTAPDYQWKVNGIGQAVNEPEFTYPPQTGDVVTCELTSYVSCATGNPATSNSLTMTVNPNLPVSVSIEASANPVDGGTPVTFTATAVNGGTSPVYQWMVNGINAGTNSNSYTYTPVNGDTVSCVLTSGELCAAVNPVNSNEVIMVVNTVPLTVVLQSITVAGTQCFDAFQTIIVAGNGTSFTVKNGGVLP
jgi:hypothetical protein